MNYGLNLKLIIEEKCNQLKYNDAEKKFKEYLPRWKKRRKQF